MFGLRSPVKKSTASSEFDSIHMIYSHSSYRELPSPWLSKITEDGELFYVDTGDVAYPVSHCSELNPWCTTSVCQCSNSEDTGYSTDNDQPSPKGERNARNTEKLDIFTLPELSEELESLISEVTLPSELPECVADMDLKVHSEKCYQVVISVNTEISSSRLSYETKCERLLGIVPGSAGDSCKSVCGERNTSKDVTVKGFTPDGPAVRLSNIHISDTLKKINGVNVTWNNIDKILATISSPQNVKLTLLRNAWTGRRLEPKSALFSDDLVCLLTGSKVNGWLSGADNSLWVLYVSMEGMTSDDVLDKEDLLYHFPPQEQVFSAVRGMFYTLCHVLKELGECHTKLSTVVLNSEKVHVSYHEEDRNLLLIAAPASKIPACLLGQFTAEIVRLLRVMVGSVDTAFKNYKHRPLLNELFSLVVKCHLSPSPDDQTCGPSPLVRSLCQSSEVQYLPLCDDIMLSISNMLSDFEAADFVDMSDNFYGCRRSYTILGSALFYKGYLLCSHLCNADLSDIHLYLKHHCLLSLTRKHAISQLVVWRQAFPTRLCDDVSQINSNFGYSEPHAQWFLLVVGLKHGLFATILEAGGCASQIEGQPHPDPFYIDQARSTLMQTQTTHVVTHCESRLAGDGLPHLSVADDHITKSADRLTLSLAAKGSDDLLKNGLSLPPGVISLRPAVSGSRKHSAESDDSSASGGSDGLFKSNRKTRLFPTGSEPTPLVQDVSLANTLCSKISSGKSSCLFHYIHNDMMSGVCVSPPATSTHSLSHTKLLLSFYRCCAQIKHTFAVSTQRKNLHTDDEPLFNTDTSLRNVRECGILFRDDHHVVTDGKKSKSSLCYWVVGRRFSRPVRRELYVCFHESTPQNLVEMAFHLGFSLLNPG